MRKLAIIVFEILLCGTVIFSQQIENNSYSAEMVGYWAFNSNKVSYDMNGYILNGRQYPEKSITNETFTISNEGKIPFINVKDEKYVILKSEILLLLFGSDGRYYFEGVTGSGRHIESIFQPEKVTASSFLTENSVKYLPENVKFYKLDFPWVEGAKGYGIDEIISVFFWTKVNALIIVNGFVSYNRPYLYTKNSRVKRIEVTIDNGENTEYTLNDDPNPQTIILKTASKNVSLKILDVYKGDKYEDTCISMINGIEDISIFNNK